MKKQNKEMLNIFWSSFKGDKTAISLITPQNYVENIKEIKYETLKKNGIENLVFDIDNTIMPVNEIMVTQDLKDFFNKLKKDFTICLLSNNDKQRVHPVAKILQVKEIENAHKPTEEAYEKLRQTIEIKKNNTIMIGDQMLTDIFFGNKFNLYTILVEPFKRKYDFKTGTNRILQNILMKKIKTLKRYQYF